MGIACVLLGRGKVGWGIFMSVHPCVRYVLVTLSMGGRKGERGGVGVMSEKEKF